MDSKDDEESENRVVGHEALPRDTIVLYRRVLEALNRCNLPYLIGGSYALNHYTQISRHTKDFDIFIARRDYDRIGQALSDAGYDLELTYPHWLAKVRANGDVIDLVFSSGNGVAEVDQEWFDHSVQVEIFGVPAQLCPVEEMLWSKAFIMERERFDGADVAHLILTKGRRLDWPRLLRRFEPHWQLLLSHLILFQFIYPAQCDLVPSWLMDQLLQRMDSERRDATSDKVCRGTLLSREQYLTDIQQWGYRDARLQPNGRMTKRETAQWTDAIRHGDD